MTAVPQSTIYGASLLRSWATVTEWHIIFRPCLNTNTDGTNTCQADPFMLVVDRERTGWWSVWRYPWAAKMGKGNPFQAIVFGVDTFIFMSGPDGQVYQQPTRVIDSNNLIGVFESPASQFTPDDDDINVTSAYRSRLSDHGDPLLQKQARGAQFIGTSATNSASVQYNTLGIDGKIHTGFSPVGGQSQTVPFEAAFNLDDVPLGFANWYLMSVQLTADNLWLRGWGLWWRPMRYAGRGNLSG